MKPQSGLVSNPQAAAGSLFPLVASHIFNNLGAGTVKRRLVPATVYDGGALVYPGSGVTIYEGCVA